MAFSKKIAHWLLTVIAVGVFVVLVTTLLSRAAGAAVGSGSGSTGGSANCSGGGITGCPWTSNGFGWFKLPINGSGGTPNGNGRWQQAVQACTTNPEYTADSIIAFVVKDGTGSMNNAWIYNYSTTKFKLWWSNNQSNISYESVEWEYNTLPDNEKQGFQLGGANGNVGWFCGDRHKREDYTTTGTTVVDRTAAKPGETIKWTHTLRNNGPTKSSSIYSKTVNSGFSDNTFNGEHNQTNGVIEVGAGNARQHTSYSTYTVLADDVGHTLCQQLQWDPTNSDGGRHGRAPNATTYPNGACVYVPYNYNLVPTVTGVPDYLETDGIVTTVRGHVANTIADATKSYPTDVRYYRVTYPVGTTPSTTSGTDATSNGCNFYDATSSSVDCEQLTSPDQINNRVFGVGDTDLSFLKNYEYHSLAPGTQVCWGISVRGYSPATGKDKTASRYSKLMCTTVAKKPKVQVWGGNLQVGRGMPGGSTSAAGGSNVVTSLTTLSQGSYAGTYGSWVEYGIFAPNQIIKMASASGLNASGISNRQCNWSEFTFTTSAVNPAACSDDNAFGRYSTSTASIPNVAEMFPVTSDTRSLSTSSSGVTTLNNVINPNGIVTTNRTALTIKGGTIGAGHWAVLNASGTNVTISENIKYSTGSLSDVSKIPQLIIIAKNITIDASVTTVDAWLIATNAISTCNQHGTAEQLSAGTYYTSNNARLTMDDCSKHLRVNGPVMAGRIYLRRTAGSAGGNQAGEPAETFNFRPDAYLWLSQRSQSSIYRTTNIKELPPRY